MRFRELRHVLKAIVLAGLPTAACVSGGDGECTHEVERTLHISLPTDAPMELKVESCRVDIDACPALCSTAMERAGIFEFANECKVRFQDSDVAIDVKYTVYDGRGFECGGTEGRRPAGLEELGRINAVSSAGAYLAHAAWLEAASIYAFVALARELEQRGAPAGLVRWALVAARDEVKHTTMMTRLAMRYGARPTVPQVAPPAPRSLEAMAIENAIEGCVRETWGAVVALWQAQTARDPEVRAAYTTIARDEARHAGLAWAIDRWLAPQLSADARARVAAARELAARELFDAEQLETIADLGLPNVAQARSLLGRTYDALWNGGHS